jgi:hypothetical protein
MKYFLLYSNSTRGCLGIFDKKYKAEYYHYINMFQHLAKENNLDSDSDSDEENEYKLEIEYKKRILKKWDILFNVWYFEETVEIKSKVSCFYVISEFWNVGETEAKFIEIFLDLNDAKKLFRKITDKYDNKDFTPEVVIEKYELNVYNSTNIEHLFYYCKNYKNTLKEN